MGLKKTLILSISISLFYAFNSHAVLGQKAKFKKSDLKFQQAQGLYQVYEHPLGQATVKEYAGEDGTVFAVRWRGSAHPNLKKLLGSYFDNYQKALALRRHQTAPKLRYPFARIEADGLIIQLSGHMRDMQGFVSAQDLVPKGVHIHALQ